MKKSQFVLIVTITNLIGCSAIQLQPNAERVIVTRNAPPKNCKFLNSITGSQGNFFTGGYTSNKNLAAGALNDLKNQAADMGANYVQLETNQAGVTGAGGGYYGGGGGFSQTDVTNTGNAYHCNPQDIGLD